MAVAIKNPPKKRGGMPTPPTPTQTKNNLATPNPEDLVPLQFAVPADFKRDFKTTAASKGKTMVDVLKEAFDLWKQENS